jgi:hypothetical protein
VYFVQRLEAAVPKGRLRIFLSVGQFVCAGLFGGIGLWERLSTLNQTIGNAPLWEATAPLHLWPLPYKFAAILNMPAALAGMLFSAFASASGPVVSEVVGGIVSLVLTLPLWYWIGFRFDCTREAKNSGDFSFWLFLSTIVILSFLGAFYFGPIDYLLWGIVLWLAAALGVAVLTRTGSKAASAH